IAQADQPPQTTEGDAPQWTPPGAQPVQFLDMQQQYAAAMQAMQPAEEQWLKDYYPMAERMQGWTSFEGARVSLAQVENRDVYFTDAPPEDTKYLTGLDPELANPVPLAEQQGFLSGGTPPPAIAEGGPELRAYTPSAWGTVKGWWGAYQSGQI